MCSKHQDPPASSHHIHSVVPAIPVGEAPIKASQLPKLLPRTRSGKKPDIATGYQHVQGTKRKKIRLVALDIGIGLYISLEALRQFCGRLTATKVARPCANSQSRSKKHVSVELEIVKVRASLRKGVRKSSLQFEPLQDPMIPPQEKLGFTNEETRPKKPVVTLRGPHDPPVVFGKAKHPLSPAKFSVLKTLVDAGELGLRKGQLEKVKPDAVKYLRSLREKDADWARAIIMAGIPWRGYRILHE